MAGIRQFNRASFSSSPAFPLRGPFEIVYQPTSQSYLVVDSHDAVVCEWRFLGDGEVDSTGRYANLADAVVLKELMEVRAGLYESATTAPVARVPLSALAQDAAHVIDTLREERQVPMHERPVHTYLPMSEMVVAAILTADAESLWQHFEFLAEVVRDLPLARRVPLLTSTTGGNAEVMHLRVWAFNVAGGRMSIDEVAERRAA